MALPDPLALLRAYLLPLVAPVPVVVRVPDPRPEKLVQIRRVGGPAVAPVRDRPRIDVLAWAATDAEAVALQSTARSAIWALRGTGTLGVMVYDVEEFLGPRLDDDPEYAVPRCWATYQLTIRADDITPAPAT